MPIAITEDHLALFETANDLLAARGALESNRALLEAADEPLHALFVEAAEMGWLGLHLPEELGGSGFGIEELVVVVEALGRSIAPGPIVPTMAASAVIDACGDDVLRSELLPGLADGSLVGTVAHHADASLSGGALSGSAIALGGALASVILVPVGGDLAVVRAGEGVSAELPPNLDPSRRAARLSFSGAPATVVPGAATTLRDLARVIFSAEAVGMAGACTDLAAAYAKERVQFGRVIGTFQAVKHLCADMAVATELATSAVWDAAMAVRLGGEQLAIAAATAAALAGPAADLCANLSTQVHGGIAMTWEHDLHLYNRRATVLLSVLKPEQAAAELSGLVRQGVVRTKDITLPPEAEEIRVEVAAFADSIADLDAEAQRDRLIETGYVVPSWPQPYGRAAGAIEQIVIEQEFARAGIRRPSYGITSWNILTLIQHATEEQASRWVLPALRQEVIWCQLFSEPNAGSDAAGVQTKATRVDGGWIVNGQKVWTSGAHQAAFGLATVRTDPDKPKHEGITTMVIDMHADGVEVRPLRQASGQSEFNEVFFTDVFVPDDDVVGPVDAGWTVARATLGNESVSIGSGDGGLSLPGSVLVDAIDKHPGAVAGGESRVGRYIAEHQAMGLLNLRAASRAVLGGGPGPEGAITKLVLSEIGHEAAAILAEANGAEVAFMEGDAAMVNALVLMHRAMSIAGGTSEIKRNQIGERILGLPRDPTIK